jgi:hypothetical protein
MFILEIIKLFEINVSIDLLSFMFLTDKFFFVTDKLFFKEQLIPLSL